MADYLPTSIKNLNTKLGEQLLDGGGGGDSWTVLTEESVTTTQGGGSFSQGNLTYSQPINADTIRVTFNGTEYECTRTVVGDGEYVYGGFSQGHPDFTEYPFALYSSDANEVYTETAGTYTIKIEAPQSGGSSDFSTAEVTIVNNCADDSTWVFPYFIDSPMATSIAELYVPANSSLTKQIILYKNMGVVTTASAFSDIQITGNAELSEGILVTGDCTITIS